jgi:hypothetical protein
MHHLKKQHLKLTFAIVQQNVKLPKVLPALNASQLHQSMQSPMTALEGLPIGGSPGMSHRPNRAPIILAATKAKVYSSLSLCCLVVQILNRIDRNGI